MPPIFTASQFKDGKTSIIYLTSLGSAATVDVAVSLGIQQIFFKAGYTGPIEIPIAVPAGSGGVQYGITVVDSTGAASASLTGYVL